MTTNNTGLPEPPEGHVWFVTPSKSGTSVWVHLVHGEDFVWSEHAAPNPRSVSDAARWCIFHYEDKRDTQEQVAALCGTYPPKRLEDQA